MRSRLPLLALSLSLLNGACSTDSEALDAGDTRSDEVAELRHRIGSVFQAEHFRAEVSGAVKRDIQENPPGSVLFWNANKANGAELREVIREYSEAAQDAGSPPILFSTDYEGGGLSWSHTWKSIAGVQRFRKGFTDLVHGRWLGVAYNTDEELGLELAFLHGQIMADELASVGINYPLATVSDLASGLFSVRGIDQDPDVVAKVMESVLDGALTNSDMVFVTKHFPGLGQTRGDTHDQIVTSSVTTNEEAERHLSPFRQLVDHSKQENKAERLSVMCSHAKFPFYDPERNTTISPVMLQSILRDELGFEGIAISDAMWMGPYGRFSTKDLHRIYLESFLAGMDMLMIPGGKYRGARQYFESVFDNTLSGAERSHWEQRLGMTWEEIHSLFDERLVASVARIDATTRSVGYVHEVLAERGVTPSDTTAEMRRRYHEILQQIDPKWATKL